VIFLALDFDRAEAREMVGEKLRVEQFEAAEPEPPDQVDERDFRRVALEVKHALAEKRAAERNAVEAAHEFSVAPGFDGVAMAAAEKFAVEPPDALVDPGLAPAGRGGGASVDDRVEVAVGVNLEAIGTNGARKPAGDVKTLDRHDPAPLRVDPIEARVLRALGHREDAAGIGLQQHFRRDFSEMLARAGHAAESTCSGST